MEQTELYAPQLEICIGSYTFHQGIQIEVCSAKSSYFDWAKVRFTEPYQSEILLKKYDAVSIQLGYGDSLEDVFVGYVSAPYNSGASANEVILKDKMLLMENATIYNTFLDTTPQEILTFILSKAGFSDIHLSAKEYPVRKILPIQQQNAVQAIHSIHAAWGIQVPFFCVKDTFYWDEKPEQKEVYTFEYGVNILSLRRIGGIWELETVSVPFVKHSCKIQVIHPQFCGEAEVSKVIFRTNDAGFIRTYLYF